MATETITIEAVRESTGETVGSLAIQIDTNEKIGIKAVATDGGYGSGNLE